MDIATKLEILADAAKYDVACTSSGINRSAKKGELGNTIDAGICHSFTADGRCITLLKVLMTNACIYNCAYCVNRAENEVRRAIFKPRELADLTVGFYRRNYIEGLFLSSGVIKSPDYTTELMIQTLSILRNEYKFRGYIHAKAVPGTSPELVEQLGHLADRMSVNMELPSRQSLALLAPDKSKQNIVAPMRQIKNSIAEDRDTRALMRRNTTYYSQAPIVRKERAFAPAGQSTQMIIGATPESDYQILTLSSALYRTLSLKRVFFSAYLPVNADKRLPNAGVQLNREHRLYQADWLMRFYKFDATELIDEAHPFLDPELDPKANWALNNLGIFPVEVNTANLETLLRVPGIGPRGARSIIRARRSTCLREPELRKLGIALKRARYFITCAGKYQGCSAEFNPSALRAKLAAPINGGKHGSRNAKVAPGQMSIFDLQPQVNNEAQPAFSTRLNLPNVQSGNIGTGTVFPSGVERLMPYPKPDSSYAFIYDGTLEGLLCTIFETYRRKLVPSEIATEENLQLRLGQQPITIPTSPAIAQRVKDGLYRDCGHSTFNAIKVAFLSDEPDKGATICSFVRYAMKEKGNVLGQIAHPCVEPMVKLHRFVMNERHHMMQFLRFREMQGGVWFATCSPKANVIPILMDWFAARFNTQPFIIFDEAHGIAGVSHNGAWTLVKSDTLTLPEETADEALMADAWKRFYDAVAIKERYNPELRRGFMPKRLWGNITEMQERIPGNSLHRQ